MVERIQTEPTIREASSGDAPLLRELLHLAFREYEGRLDPPSGVHAETEASLAEKLDCGGALVCYVGEVPAGCAFYAREPGFLYVGRFGVLPEYRRTGAGTLLLRATERRARGLGYDRVRLNVRLTLGNLRAYYEGRGYRPVEYLAHEGYPGATYVQMEKVLGGGAAGRASAGTHGGCEHDGRAGAGSPVQTGVESTVLSEFDAGPESGMEAE